MNGNQNSRNQKFIFYPKLKIIPPRCIKYFSPLSVNFKILFYAVLVSAMVFLICSVMSFVVTLIPDATAVIFLFGGIPIFVGIIFNVQSSIIIEIFPTYIR